MKLEIESTDQIITAVVNGVEAPARIWRGRTEGGVPCSALITRIAVHKDEDNDLFERELIEKPPAPATDADRGPWPLRMFID